jgi:hypothetical protein
MIYSICCLVVSVQIKSRYLKLSIRISLNTKKHSSLACSRKKEIIYQVWLQAISYLLSFYYTDSDCIAVLGVVILHLHITVLLPHMWASYVCAQINTGKILLSNLIHCTVQKHQSDQSIKQKTSTAVSNSRYVKQLPMINRMADHSLADSTNILTLWTL